MSNLFKRVACFTDIHYGMKHNSRQHNNDCEQFLKWFVNEAKERDCETCIFLGDFHHHRSTVNVSTLNYITSALDIMSKSFENVYFIVGNHDLYYREKREIHSLPMGRVYDNIHMIEDVFIKDDVAIVPWLVHDEWKKVTKIDTKYMFGHFEIPGFKMNALVEMPDHGDGLNNTCFKNQDYVFSGHFHKRQADRNIHYIGNPFGHNYADAWDFDRGAMFMEWGKEPKYVNWEDGPRYITIKLSKLLEDPDLYLSDKTSAKVETDVDISYEEATFLKETFVDNYNVREFKLVSANDVDVIEDLDSDVNFETVDQIVIDQLSNISSDKFNRDILIEMYNRLD